MDKKWKWWLKTDGRWIGSENDDGKWIRSENDNGKQMGSKNDGKMNRAIEFWLANLFIFYSTLYFFLLL